MQSVHEFRIPKHLNELPYSGLMQHFDNISDFLRYTNQPPAEHPQLYIYDLDAGLDQVICKLESSPPITTDFYGISLKRGVQGKMNYGRTKYDFDKGAMVFTAPRQVVQWDNIFLDNRGFSIYFHENFIKGHHLANEIKRASFFGYATNEALHLSTKEEALLVSLFKHIAQEYHNNQDEFSKDITLSLIATLLKYSERFYKRQFLNRKDLNTELHVRFRALLADYFESNQLEQKGIPTVEWMAQKLNVSQRYLSDTLKTETGKTSVDLINLFLIEEAKNLLLAPNASITETAYKLGFTYPQYFSRVFKQKMGISPRQYIEQQRLN